MKSFCYIICSFVACATMLACGTSDDCNDLGTYTDNSFGSIGAEAYKSSYMCQPSGGCGLLPGKIRATSSPAAAEGYRRYYSCGNEFISCSAASESDVCDIPSKDSSNPPTGSPVTGDTSPGGGTTPPDHRFNNGV